MEKEKENKGKFGMGFLTEKEDQPEENPNPEEGKEEALESEEEEASEDEDPAAEEADETLEEEEAPAWLEMVIKGTGGADPSRVTDKELVEIKGIGKGILKQIREVYPYQEPKRSGKVMIEILPMRGIGGVGGAGTQAEMEWEQAEQYARDGYVKILE